MLIKKTTRFCLAVILFSGLGDLNRLNAAEVEYYTSPAIKELKLPFSEAVRVGNRVYLSGQLGMDPSTGKLVEGGIQAETRQTMENIKKTLKYFHLGFDDLIQCRIFLKDIKEWGVFNTIYKSYFNKHYPARSAFGANGLGLGAALEMECHALIKK